MVRIILVWHKEVVFMDLKVILYLCMLLEKDKILSFKVTKTRIYITIKK